MRTPAHRSRSAGAAVSDDDLWQRALRRVWAAQARRIRRDAPITPIAPPVAALGPLAAEPPGSGVRWPLAGDTANRARAALDTASPQDRARIDALQDGAVSTRHRAWVQAALAGGADVATLATFAARITDTPARRLASGLDPLHQPVGVLRQQTSTTCGSASLVVARMLTDPVYAMWVLDGYDARTAQPVAGDVRSRFRDQEQSVMRRTNGVRTAAGGLQLPWPRALGTPPWGAAAQMSAGAVGTRYRVRAIDSDSPRDRARAWDALAACAHRGRPAPLYVGDGAVPRHVVLVVGRRGDALTIFDPALGSPRTVDRQHFVAGPIQVAGWHRPWAAVVPW